MRGGWRGDGEEEGGCMCKGGGDCKGAEEGDDDTRAHAHTHNAPMSSGMPSRSGGLRARSRIKSSANE